MIEIHDLTKKFRSLTAVNHVSLDVPTGCVFGLLGTNGAGKSTLLRMLSGILKPDAGTIHIDGQAAWDNEPIKADVFYLSDKQYYFPNASAESMGRFYQKLYTGFAYDRYLSLLEEFHLDPMLKLRTFSKGMRVSIHNLYFGLRAGTVRAETSLWGQPAWTGKQHRFVDHYISCSYLRITWIWVPILRKKNRFLF